MVTQGRALSAIVGDNIRLRRAAARIGQQEVADALNKAGHNWTHTTVSTIEHGTRKVSVDELATLAEFFGVDPLALIRPPTIQ